MHKLTCIGNNVNRAAVIRSKSCCQISSFLTVGVGLICLSANGHLEVGGIETELGVVEIDLIKAIVCIDGSRDDLFTIQFRRIGVDDENLTELLTVHRAKRHNHFEADIVDCPSAFGVMGLGGGVGPECAKKQPPMSAAVTAPAAGSQPRRMMRVEVLRST